MESDNPEQFVSKKERLTIVAPSEIVSAPKKKTSSPPTKRRKMPVIDEDEVDTRLVKIPKATTKSVRKNPSPVLVFEKSDDLEKSFEYESVRKKKTLV